MSGDQLTLRSPGDRVITEYLCDHALIADCAVQLQQTGEQTLELHQFVMSIIADEIEVQEGISIEALRDMALTVGNGLGPLGEYFCELATATWAYADACRIAGDRTKHLFERTANLANSLEALILEREQDEGWEASTRALPEDGTAHGWMIPYSGLNEEGGLALPGSAINLEGVEKQEALQLIGAHQEDIQTLFDGVHRRNEEQLSEFDAAVEAWEIEANAFMQSLDGILGVLADTKAEDEYQQLGTVAEVASWAGTASDAVTLIPGGQGIGLLGGTVASAIETALNAAQGTRAEEALNKQFQPGEDSIRVVEGQALGESSETAAAASGFIPMGQLLSKFRYKPLREAWEDVYDFAAGLGQQLPTASGPERDPDLPVDVGVSTAPIDAWQEEADAKNPEVTYEAGQPMPSAEERRQAVPLDPDDPVRIPTATAPEEHADGRTPTGAGIEVEKDA